jgi:hypothetical protein
MRAKEFKEQNIVYAKDQPEYLPLPGHKVNEPEGRFIFCQELTLTERLTVLFKGEIWISLMTFNKPLTPSFFTTKKSDLFNKPSNENNKHN